MNHDKPEDEFLNLLIYRKGKEIFDLVHTIAALIPENDDHLQNIKAMMISDAAQLFVKVAGAEAAELYDIKMENAAIIRKAARDLMLHNQSLRIFGFKEVHYYYLVRNLIEEYRSLYIDWVANFDAFNYVIDRWGLFNPPGVGPFDKDVDEIL